MLLADEPTGNLAAETGGRVLEALLERVGGHSMATLVASHNAVLSARMQRCLALLEGSSSIALSG